jgi:uncharacterized protein (UPF0261 family)
MCTPDLLERSLDAEQRVANREIAAEFVFDESAIDLELPLVDGPATWEPESHAVVIHQMPASRRRHEVQHPKHQIAGAAAVDELVRERRVHGVIGIGGGTATLVATSIMKRLPFGMPKLMASPMAAHPAYIDKYVGTRDITMHHTVLDIVKMNPLLRAQIVNAVGAARIRDVDLNLYTPEFARAAVDELLRLFAAAKAPAAA